MDEPISCDNREEYNEFVQRAQEVLHGFGIEHRIRPTTHDNGAIDSEFEAFWGEWRNLAYERNAMTPEALRVIIPDELTRIEYEAAGEVTR